MNWILCYQVEEWALCIYCTMREKDATGGYLMQLEVHVGAQKTRVEMHVNFSLLALDPKAQLNLRHPQSLKAASLLPIILNQAQQTSAYLMDDIQKCILSTGIVFTLCFTCFIKGSQQWTVTADTLKAHVTEMGIGSEAWSWIIVCLPQILAKSFHVNGWNICSACFDIQLSSKNIGRHVDC